VANGAVVARRTSGEAVCASLHMVSVVGHHHAKTFQNETAPFQFEIFSGYQYALFACDEYFEDSCQYSYMVTPRDRFETLA
jgi:hypothetical protein